MTSPQTLVPEIRFEGFSSAWERHKLGEFCEITTGRLDANAMVPDGKYDFYTSGIAKYKIDIPAFSGPAITIAGNGATVGYMHLADGLFNAYQRTYVLSGFGADRQYLFYAIGTKLPEKIAQEARTGNIPYIVMDMLTNLDIDIPSMEEQALIGECLKKIGSLIVLHRRKQNQLKNVKKSMLEKMFPRDGANVPEIRFAGFTNAWEQRKLSEVADKVTEKNVDLAVHETFTNSAEYGVISQRDFFDHDISNAENIGGYYVVRNEDFVYNPRISVTAPVGPVNRNKLGRNGVMSPLYTVFRTHDIDTTYLEWFFKSSYWHPFMFFNGDSGARSDRFSIKDAVFFEMPIPTPSLAEQRWIGAYMDKLDNLITLHQCKCDKLKDLKNSLLRKMFL